ncbi:aconitase family protein [Billgrantia aerodenitrificans]|uniref:3-isopropylmalate dehydratase n=1 Tax=Billgrantia aerodenitrificans TaxID=2733483 RepID=A0ABS9ANN9_9GAMM|nr:aconitase family protein [Halomonas aerodenitrificans]MCE8023200.1 3-isopropylmalate dehydratase [Halomonas aerodenitrificans]
MQRTVPITGRVLYLSEDPEKIDHQLAGHPIDLDTAGPLRDNVSTDEITPTTIMLVYDERLGRYPYVGFKAGERLPIPEQAIREGGFAVTVAGKRYGKGSSRESSPLAELSAGIRLIIAESFERIYLQNCDNIGILTSTDFSLLDKLASGEAIPIEAFLEGRDAVTQEIIRHGGLLAYSKSKQWPRVESVQGHERAEQPLTLIEKIIQRHLHPEFSDSQRGEGIFVAADWRFSHDYFTGMCAHLIHNAFGDEVSLERPERIIAFQDHLVLASESHPHVTKGLLPGVANLASGHDQFVQRYKVKAHGVLKEANGSEGICHALMAERYALPGEVVVGTDSHTPHSGALGCFAFGAGATDIANSWVTGYIRCKKPETLRIELMGELKPGVTAKDIVLHLLTQEPIKSGGAIGLVFEYGGSAVRKMSIDERATLTNMVAEMGGLTGIVEPDEVTQAFLHERRGIDFEIEGWMRSDPGADYKETLSLNVNELGPMLASPGDPGNGLHADELKKLIPIDIAYGGSCTAGKRDDFDCYHEVLAWGLENGLRIPEHTKFYLQFGTLDVKKYCEEKGYLNTFEQMGVTLIMPGCGACANCGPGSSTRSDQVTISAINRNFPGRSGPGGVWLASPYTVAASALLGRIGTFLEVMKIKVQEKEGRKG